jgi:hypothetical protein
MCDVVDKFLNSRFRKFTGSKLINRIAFMAHIEMYTEREAVPQLDNGRVTSPLLTLQVHCLPSHRVF